MDASEEFLKRIRTIAGVHIYGDESGTSGNDGATDYE